MNNNNNNKKSVQMKQKGKLKYTSNMRSQNEVIQVRCVEIKLKVNNNNNNKQQQETRETKRRDKTTEKELIYSVVLLVAP